MADSNWGIVESTEKVMESEWVSGSHCQWCTLGMRKMESYLGKILYGVRPIDGWFNFLSICGWRVRAGDKINRK